MSFCYLCDGGGGGNYYFKVYYNNFPGVDSCWCSAVSSSTKSVCVCVCVCDTVPALAGLH